MNNSTIGKVFIATSIAVGLGFGAGAFAQTPEPAEPRAHSDGFGAALDDTAITAKIKAALISDDALKASKISVTTTNGVVTLSGTASTAEAKSAAESLAMQVEGVKSVDNDLKMPGEDKTLAKAKQAVSDSWITTKVKSAILADSVSKGFEVKVKTTNGVVVLKGSLANPDAIAHVKDVAAKVDGVKSVDTSALVVASR